MTQESIKNELRKFLSDTFFLDLKKQPLEDTDSFLEKGIIDSTGILELVSFIQERFNIEVRDNELLPDNLDSIENVYKYVLSKHH